VLVTILILVLIFIFKLPALLVRGRPVKVPYTGLNSRDHMKSLASSSDVASEARCECGQLVAKLRQNGVELKCKRCKRIVLIPFSSEVGDEPFRSVHL